WPHISLDTIQEPSERGNDRPDPVDADDWFTRALPVDPGWISQRTITPRRLRTCRLRTSGVRPRWPARFRAVRAVPCALAVRQARPDGVGRRRVGAGACREHPGAEVSIPDRDLSRRPHDREQSHQGLARRGRGALRADAWRLRGPIRGQGDSDRAPPMVTL